jgi:DNA polymerase III subunit delta'
VPSAAPAVQLKAAAKQPVHAYLFVGPPGTGKRQAARAFAATLLCEAGGEDDCVTCGLVLDERHPDFVVVEREGASIRVGQARDIIRLAARSPVEGDRKVLLLTDFHLVEEAGPALLKTIEEPPASTIFVILAEQVPPELVTIASRCVRIDFPPLSADAIANALVADGIDTAAAAAAAASAGGRLDRARLLASDAGFVARRDAWLAVPSRLDGTGAAVAKVVDELVALLDESVAPLKVRQQEEVAVLEERMERYGEKGSAAKELEDRHRRELRRLRTDELRWGLSLLAGVYRDRAVESTGPSLRAATSALEALATAGEELIRNPNETLQMQALLLRLSN